jgi:hypothetical protein
MKQVFQVCAYLFGLPLELMVIAVLMRGEYRRYPFLFLYAVVDFLTTVLEIQPAIAYGSASAEAKYNWAIQFWIYERIMQVLVFLLVISLVYTATKHLRPRRTLLTGIICGTVLVAVISFLAHYNANIPTGRYMTRITRDLNFCAAILLVGLWTLLISARQKDYKLLMITGGLGIQFAGGAIGQALRDMSPAIVMAASDFTVIANLARLYIWWQALRVKPKKSATLVSDSPK